MFYLSFENKNITQCTIRKIYCSEVVLASVAPPGMVRMMSLSPTNKNKVIRKVIAVTITSCFAYESFIIIDYTKK